MIRSICIVICLGLLCACGSEEAAAPATPRATEPAEQPAQTPAPADVPETPEELVATPAPAAPDTPQPDGAGSEAGADAQGESRLDKPFDLEAVKRATEPPAPPGGESSGPMVTAYLKVVDLEGNPLARINPIVTTQPNAFDRPVAVGQLTGPNGEGTVQFHSDRNLFVRAWDPNLNWFPNNFYEVPADSGTVAKDMVISMVQAALIEVQLNLADGAPAAEMGVSVMMRHPQWGPWWPAQGATDQDGVVFFPNTPPGKFTLDFEGEGGLLGTLEEAVIKPGTVTQLGVVTLQ